MNFLLLMVMLFVAGAVTAFLAKAGGLTHVYDSRAADILFFVVSVGIAIERGARIFNWITGR